ncbi:cytochrome P450 89A2-like [Cicer arietinum]|uniref:Cytochrome P450 89A2-like n=1 Tax=Cicer arietinum TaxID=3827 RepID=A0A1S2YTX5_CICAR|nr:cytochrome P450 89A2-like [Cicer arietinum]
MDTWFLVLVSLCLSILIFIFIRSLQSNNLPPGPLYFPIITDLLLLSKSFSQLESIIPNFHAKHGPVISFHFCSTLYISISDRSLAYQALIQNGTVFASRPKSLSKNTHQFNITSSLYGSTWRVLRNNLASVMLNPSRFISFSNIRKCVLKNLLNQLKLEASSNNSIKFIDHVQHSIFCLLVFMCFGEKIGNEKLQHIKHVQRRLISNARKFGALNFFPKVVSRILFRKRWQELSLLRNFQKELFVELIESRKKFIDNNNNNNNNNDENVVYYVDTLLNLKLPDEKRRLHEGEIVTLCSEFVTAGTDTTLTTLEWIMANLVKYKHVQDRIVEEIREVVGDTEEKEVSEEDLEKLPYLKAVILEGLRCHPPTRYLIPHAVTEDVVLNGCLIPKNRTVNFMVAEVGWDPTVWEDPMMFKPERFLRDVTSSNGFDVCGKKELKMMPFGAGKRMCPAYKLAMLHLEYFVANLVLNFQWNTSLPNSNVDFSEKQEFTMVMKHPLEATISSRI